MDQNKQEVIQLPRGGYLAHTPIGPIQFGSPPETIKDTMGTEHGVPQYFVLPKKFFNWIKGISVAEVEFPLYYNFFLKKRKTTIICTPEQHKRFMAALQQAVFGPEDLDLLQNYSSELDPEDLPPIKAELDFFRHGLQLDDLVEFRFFENDQVLIEDLKIELEEDKEFLLSRRGEELARVPAMIEYHPTYDIGRRLPEPYKPPLFGVTCLGPSHGFDPTENTSGFILWMNRRGIMIDPPVNTTEWLVASNVNPKLIDSIILTHCHADHDAGTFQKILEESKVDVYTVPTVMNSFLRKYSALTGVSREYLQQLFEYRPVSIDQPAFINGGKFTFHFSLHSIPTIGFQLEHEGASFVYSSDHNNDPEIHKKLYDEGLISQKRYEELLNFPWYADLIYHEAGIPPLHTPVTVLNSLPTKIRKKIITYHIAKKDFPKRTPLRLAQFGIEHTVTMPVKPPDHEGAYHILGLLDHLDIFEDIPVRKAREFVSIVKEESFRKGSRIIEKGTVGDKFYIIKSGNVAVLGKDLEHRKIYGAYDYFGEVALLTSAPRTADVVAETDVSLYTIEKEKFLHFIRNTDLDHTLRRLTQIRDSETWNILSTSPILRILTSTQKTLLESMLHKRTIDKPGTLVEEGAQYRQIYIIRDGSVEVRDGGEKVTTLGRGDFIGAMGKIHRNEPASVSFQNTTPLKVYIMKKEDVIAFLKKNPGLIMKLDYDYPGA
ncbi:MAG: cAMP/cGMP-dependent 3',5'-cyclic-AMP/GMP phosphodiesterase [Spirochaetales bacterium]|nr:cAMP/cGMP-dependent 3',5'-cyclic-AMP/GMP phosphodiesterase [Spirochaetales bacterium]MCF7937016.1 cAMP/cGMP-dependent 3',5'-cyclic-AMP/GMP phosphodiesterase [Spirochaetales bacterium]